MPSSISLDNQIYKIKEKRDFLGAVVPWECTGYLEDLVAAETVGGVFDFSAWSTLKISGKDTRDFLQRMSTVNFKTFSSMDATPGAFLTGKGTVISLGTFLEEKGNIHYIVSPNQETAALEHLEKFHFQEEIQIQSASQEWSTLAWWNPRGDLLQDFHLNRDMPFHTVDWRRWKTLEMLLWRDKFRPELFWIHLPRRSTQSLLFEFHRLGIPLLGQHLFEYYRIQHGIPQVGVELSEKEIILESGFDDAVARNKGCYPGQEVVERIFTYGSVNRKLKSVSVALGKDGCLPLPCTLESAEKGHAVLMSFAADPRKPGTGKGLAYLSKSEWDGPHTYNRDGMTVQYQPKAE